MSYTKDQVAAATASMDRYRRGQEGQLGSALVIVGLSAERAFKEDRILDDMIVVAHRAGASLRQLAEGSGLDRKAVTALVSGDDHTSRKPGPP